MPGHAVRGGLRPFQRLVKKSNPARQKPTTFPVVEPGPDEKITPVQGIMPDSVQEWRLAKALEGDDIRFIYQVPLWGAYMRVAGSYTLDFLVLDPFGIAVPVLGDYWHNAAMDQNLDFDLARLEARVRV